MYAGLGLLVLSAIVVRNETSPDHPGDSTRLPVLPAAPPSVTERAPPADLHAPTQAQEAFRAMDEAQRNSIFRLAIRDAGYLCDELRTSPEAGDRLAAWRISCGNAVSYLVGVEPGGDLYIDPMPYAEGPFFNPTREPTAPIPDNQ